jgi:glycosyltransferase involved in cell wall biosynthesis
MGGAEAMLAKVIAGSDRSRFVHSVISLGAETPIGMDLDRQGVEVSSLNLSLRSAVPGVFRLRKLGRRVDPDLVVGWMYHGNLAASALSVGLGSRPPVLWGIRQTLYELSREKRATAAAIRIGAMLSHRAPKRIIYNSKVAARQHAEFGYDPRREMIIPNGFDINRFKPSGVLYQKLRRDLGLSPGTVLIGMVARVHPMKRHDLFLAAIPAIRDCHPGTHFLLVGDGATPSNPEIMSHVARHKISDCLTFLGQRTDIDQILPGLDILCMSSGWGEGFPNVVGEAMCCEVPCVVTDVGDAAEVLGAAGIVISPNDENEIARGVNALLSQGSAARKTLGKAGRERVRQNFDLDSVGRKFDAVFQWASLR